jgi:hypothetical protein
MNAADHEPFWAPIPGTNASLLGAVEIGRDSAPMEILFDHSPDLAGAPSSRTD